MNKASESRLPEVTVHPENLHREDVFTDLHSATIKRLTPVLPDGATDDSRPVRFSGHTQIYSPAGVLPLDFELEAKTLPEAMAAFPASVQAAITRLAEEMEAMQRERASRIVAPGQGGGPNLIIP